MCIRDRLFSCTEYKAPKSEANQSDGKHEITLAANEFKLAGSTFNNAIAEVFLYNTRQDSLQLVDTIKVKNRQFTYKGFFEEPELFTIKTNLSNDNFNFLVDNSQIDIALSNSLKHSSTYAKSDLQKAYSAYTKTIDSFSQTKQALLNKYPTLNGSSIKKIKEERLKISKNKTAFVIDFIKSQNNTKLAPLLINNYKTIIDIKEVRALYNTLTPTIKDLVFSKELDTAIISIENKFKVNNAATLASSPANEYRTKAFDISGPNPDGITVSLNSLPQGKVILVDFWASWCAPCRAANPNIVRLYNTYKNRGFEILSVSEDRGNAEWIQAIAADNLLWPYHILDKNKSIAFRYGVESIPFNLLIDRQGRIASEKLAGNKLEQRIKQLLNE